MGFGALFLGFMFLYDFQVGLRHTGAQEAWAMLDLFPDCIGWCLLFFGLNRLAKKEKKFENLRLFSIFFLVLSLFTLAKDTLLYSAFYTESVQNFAGEAVDFCVHLLELAFIVLLFRQTAPFCRKYGEDKLALSHSNVPRIAAAEGFLFVLARLGRLFAFSDSLLSIWNVISVLDFIFTVFLVWYGTIALFRALMRISD